MASITVIYLPDTSLLGYVLDLDIRSSLRLEVRRRISEAIGNTSLLQVANIPLSDQRYKKVKTQNFLNNLLKKHLPYTDNVNIFS